MAVLPTITTSTMSVKAAPTPFDRLAGEVEHFCDHSSLQFAQGSEVVDHVMKPGDEVVAKGDLRVHGRLGGQHGPRLQVDQIGGDGGGADVDGQAEHASGLCRGPDADDGGALPHEHRDIPARLPQGARQGLKCREIELEALQPMRLFERRQQPLGVRDGVLHRRRP